MNEATPYINALRVIRDTLRNADFVTNADIANDLVDEAMMIVDLVLMEDETTDPHLACPAYPNCDINWTGCRLEAGDDVEMFGNK
jgi:hypothetical protein